MRYLNLGCGNHFHKDWVNVDFYSAEASIIAHNIRTPLPFSSENFDAVYHSHLLEHLPRSEARSFLQECLRVLRPGGVLRVVVPNLEQIAREYLRLLEEAESGSEIAAHNYDWILLEMYDQVVRHQSGGDMAKYLSANDVPNEDYIINRFGNEGKALIENLKGKNLDSLQEVTNSENLDEIALAIGRFRLSGEVHRWMYDRYSLGRLLKETGFSDIQICDATESKILNFSDYHLDVLENGQIRKPDSLFVEAIKPIPSTDSWSFNAECKQERLKVVQILTNDIQGGAARAAYRLHQGLRLVDQDSLVLARYRNSDDPFVCSISDLSPTEVRLDDYSLYAEIQANYIDSNRTDLSNTLFSYPYPAVDLTKVEQINQADILHLHWVAWFQSAETVASLLKLGKPVVWTLHDMAAFTGGCHYSAGCKKYQSDCSDCPQLRDNKYSLPAIILENKVRNLSSYSNLTIVTPSQWLADCAQRSRLFRNHRVEVIPYGIDENIFKVIAKTTAKEYLNIPTHDIVLLFGADSNQEKRKGASILIEALKKCLRSPLVQEKLQKGRIQILNFGYGGSGLDDLSIPVTCLGYVDSDEQLSYIYSAANVLLLPSFEDNLPNLMLEAMSCGTPVIAFKTGGMRDLISDEKTGKLVTPGDVEGLSDAISDCLLNPDKYEKMGFEARLRIEQEFTLKHQANRYLELYHDLLDLQKHSDHTPNGADYREIQELVNHPVIREIAIEAGCTALLKERQHVHDLKRDLEHTQAELQHTQAELQSTKAAIVAMESSMLWKIQKVWVKAKALLGFGSS